jgi:hypothetical protein
MRTTPKSTAEVNPCTLAKCGMKRGLLGASLTSRVLNSLRRQPLLAGSVIILLLAGALSTAVGTALGLANFTDVGYPDSATLLRIGEVTRSGHIYPDIDRPPYQVTVYGPLTYVLLAIPYRLAQAAGITPQVLVRLGIVGALCLCVLLIFLIGRRLYSSRPSAWLCALFAVSALPMAYWTTQIRSDFLALGFSLLSVYLFLLTNGRPQAIGSAICAGIAPLVKQTFLAVPIAIVSWLIYRRRYKEAVFWATGFALTVVGGYAIVWWREPLMLKHVAALRHPVLEYRQALGILWDAVSQPVVPFAAIGGSWLYGNALLKGSSSSFIALSRGSAQCEQSGACEVLQRMRSGRLRVFRTLEKFFQQYRLYRRDEHGQRVKQNDLLRSPVRHRTVPGRIRAARLLLPGGRIRVAARKESG